MEWYDKAWRVHVTAESPPPPTIIKTEALSDTEITVYWEKPLSPVIAFCIHYAPANGKLTVIAFCIHYAPANGKLTVLATSPSASTTRRPTVS